LLTPVGAIPEIVDDGINGILTPPSDADALAAAIERLTHDSDLRISLGRAARDKISSCFDIDRNMTMYGALYAEN